MLESVGSLESVGWLESVGSLESVGWLDAVGAVEALGSVVAPGRVESGTVAATSKPPSSSSAHRSTGSVSGTRLISGIVSLSSPLHAAKARTATRASGKERRRDIGAASYPRIRASGRQPVRNHASSARPIGVLGAPSANGHSSSAIRR